MLQRIGNLLELSGDPGEVERVGSQPGEHANIAFGRRRTLLVVHHERELAAVGQDANAALDHFPSRIPVQHLELEAEADFLVRGLKLRGIADAGNRHAADGNHVVDRVGEDGAFAGRRKNAHREDSARRVLRTREREKVGDVGRGVANRPRTINVIRHRQPPFMRSSSQATSVH